MVVVVCRCHQRVLGVPLKALWMVFRVFQENGYGDRVVLVGVYQAEVVATSLGVYLTDPRLPYLDCRK